MAFLTTRVKNTNEDDWGNMKRLLKYLKGIRHMKFTLKVDSMSMVIWWVDASCNTHECCKGHTGFMMYLGKRKVVISPRKINKY